MAKKILVAVADGTEELEAVCVIDVLRRADAEVTVASVDSQQITASRGVGLVAEKLIGQCVDETYDMIVLPGGLPGAVHLRDSEALIEMLKKQAQAGRLYAAICASPAVVLEHHGLLKNKKATCYPSFACDLSNAEAADQRVVVDGNCVTSQGPGTAVEFSVKLVELLLGKAKSQQVAEAMLAK